MVFFSSSRFLFGFTALGLTARRRCAAKRKAKQRTKWEANGQNLAKKWLCTILSLALLNTSLSPVYAMHAQHPQAIEATSEGGQGRVHTGSLGLKAISQEISQEAVQTSSYGVSTFFRGIAHLVSKGITYVLEHPGRALTLGLAAQVAATNAITPLTDDFLINQNTTGFQVWPSVAALSDGNAFVVWGGDQTGNYDIYGHVVTPNGTAITNEFRINQNTTGSQQNPSVAALSNGNAFVVWYGNPTGYDIYGRVMASNGAGLTNDFKINQNTAGGQYYPSVAALNNGNVFVAWHGDQAGNSDVYGRVMAPNGTALTNDFTINQNTTGNQVYPSVAALSNGNAFVVWYGDQATVNPDIHGRVLAPNGTALANEFTINQNTTGYQYYPSVAALSNGNAFVVWAGYQTGTGGIYGRVVAPNGTALADELVINQNTTTAERYFPSVAALNNGNAFVVWYGDQTGNPDIYGRVVPPNGTALTNEFTINQNTAGNQIDPRVAALSDGNAFVVWGGPQAGSYDIYGRIFDPSVPVTTIGGGTTGFQTTAGLMMTTELQTTTGLQTTGMSSTPNGLIPILLGVGGATAVGGLSLGGSLIGACALAGLYGIKKYKKSPQKQLEKRTSSEGVASSEMRLSITPFAATSNGFTEHPTFVGALKGRIYAIWKELSQHEAKRLQPQTAKTIPPFSSSGEKMPFFLGKGAFGATYAGSDVETGELYAIKEVYGRGAVDASLQEGEIQDKLKESSQIMALVDYKSYEPSHEKYNTEEPRLFQVMPLAYTNGVGYKHMFSVLKEDSDHEARVADNFQQLMKGIGYMHSKGIYHFDIKGDNILYMGDGTLRIGDLGRARELGQNAQMIDYRMGDRRFFSPEQFAFTRYALDKNGREIVGKEEIIDSFPAWAADAWQGGLYALELLLPKDHPLSEAVASYETKVSSWTNATFENALQSIPVLQEGSEKSFKGLLRGVLAVNLKDRLKPDMVVKTLSSSISLSSEKREQALKN